MRLDIHCWTLLRATLRRLQARSLNRHTAAVLGKRMWSFKSIFCQVFFFIFILYMYISIYTIYTYIIYVDISIYTYIIYIDMDRYISIYVYIYIYKYNMRRTGSCFYMKRREEISQLSSFQYKKGNLFSTLFFVFI